MNEHRHAIPIDHPATGLGPDITGALKGHGVETIGDFEDMGWVLGGCEGPPPPGWRDRVRALRIDDPDLGLNPEIVESLLAHGIETMGQAEDHYRGGGD